jgi:putative peptidoglycan lipid II flippase
MILRRFSALVPPFQRSRFHDAVSTTGLSLIGKSAGFLVPFFIASWFGVNPTTDAFFFAYGAILFLAGIFGPVLEVIVPYVAEAHHRGDDIEDFMSRLLGTGTVLFGLGLAGFLLVAMPLLPLVTQFSAEGTALTWLLLLEASPLTVLLFWTSIISGYLNACKQFALPALSPAVRASVNLSFIFLLKDRFGIHSLVLGYIAGEIVRLMVLVLTVAIQAPFRFRPALRLNQRLREFYGTSFYAVIAMVWVLANQLVDNAMASWLLPGSVTVLQYAGNLYMIPLNLFSGGIVTVLLAHWSESYCGSREADFQHDVVRSTWGAFWLTLPATVALILLSRPITQLLLAHGVFDHAKVGMVAMVWSGYLAGFPLQAMAQLYVKALLVQKRTKTLMWGAFYSIFLNVLGNTILMQWFGVAGIALATSGTAAFSALYFRRCFRSASATKASCL